MAPFLALTLNIVIALLLIGVASGGERLLRLLGRRTATLAALPLLSAAVLSAFVLGQDSYRGNDISRWEAYRSPGGALGPMFFLSILAMAACAALLVHAALQHRGGRLRVTALAGGLTALLLITPTLVGFSAN
jgi:hypothetical protein